MLIGESKDRESSAAYPDASQAIDFACTVLKQKSASIWTQGPARVHIERSVIMLNAKRGGACFASFTDTRSCEAGNIQRA